MPSIKRNNRQLSSRMSRSRRRGRNSSVKVPVIGCAIGGILSTALFLIVYMLQTTLLENSSIELGTAPLTRGYKKDPSQHLVSSSISNRRSTVVTSMYDDTTTKEELDNLLTITDPMIIFTTSALKSKVQSHRKHAPTFVAVQELSEIDLIQKMSTGQWEKHKRKDGTDRPMSIYWEMACKVWFLKEAATRLNPFHSTDFVFFDLYNFKKAHFFQDKQVIQHPEIIPEHQMLFMSIRKLVAPPTVWLENRQKIFQYFYHSNFSIAGKVETIEAYYKAYETAFLGYVKHNVNVMDDHLVAQSTCLQSRDLCSYIPADAVELDRPATALRTALYKGGTFQLLQPPATTKV